MSSVFGKAKFGGKGRNYYKLKDGSNGPYRILPPMGELSSKGAWRVFLSIHYGYRNSAGKSRAFVSPLQRNQSTKMVEVPDAALDRLNQLKAELQKAKDAGNADLVKKLLELVGGQKSRFNLDSHHYMNVVDLQGNIGVLKIRHLAYKALIAKIEELRAQGVDPLDAATGRFLTFNRSGMGRDTTYSVSVYQEKLNIDGVGEVKRDVVHSISEDLASRCCVITGYTTENGVKKPIYEYREAANLNDIYKRLSSEEVARIVAEGEKAVDEIFDSKAAAAGTPVDLEDDGYEDEDVVEAAPVAAPVVSSAPSTPATQGMSVPVAPVATPVAPVSPAVSAVFASAPVAPVAPTVNHAAMTTAQTAEEMSDADFLKKLGLGGF